MAVTAEKVGLALGREPYSSVEAAQWELWIEDARLIIEDRLGDLDLLDQAKLDYVVRSAVVEHVRNPDNATEVTVSVDDASSSRKYRSSRGRVTILDEWWAMLSPKQSYGAFSVDTVGVGWVHSFYCDLVFGGGSCSCGANLAGFPIFGGP